MESLICPYQIIVTTLAMRAVETMKWESAGKFAERRCCSGQLFNLLQINGFKYLWKRPPI